MRELEVARSNTRSGRTAYGNSTNRAGTWATSSRAPCEATGRSPIVWAAAPSVGARARSCARPERLAPQHGRQLEGQLVEHLGGPANWARSCVPRAARRYRHIGEREAQPGRPRRRRGRLQQRLPQVCEHSIEDRASTAASARAATDARTLPAVDPREQRRAASDREGWAVERQIHVEFASPAACRSPPALERDAGSSRNGIPAHPRGSAPACPPRRGRPHVVPPRSSGGQRDRDAEAG